MAKTVLAFLPEGFEEIEFVTPVDIWRRAGFEVTIAALRFACPLLPIFHVKQDFNRFSGVAAHHAFRACTLTCAHDLFLANAMVPSG